MHLIWLRTDLRLHDNTALAAAAQRGPTAAVYLISPGQWLAHDDAPCKVDFWLRNLQRLNSALGELNIPLLIRHADTWDQAPEVLAGLCQELSVESVHVNDEYGIHEERRDAAVAKALEAQGITFHTYLDQLFFQPGSVLTHAGNRWSLGIVHLLGVNGRLRHAEIGRRMEGVTQRMLTRTLRQLERDGLVLRHDFQEVPPKVEYQLSELGKQLLVHMIPLWTWVVENADGFRRSREQFDADQAL